MLEPAGCEELHDQRLEVSLGRHLEHRHARLVVFNCLSDVGQFAFRFCHACIPFELLIFLLERGILGAGRNSQRAVFCGDLVVPLGGGPLLFEVEIVAL